MAFNFVSFGLLTSDVVGLTPAQQTAEELQLTFSVVNEGSQLFKNFRFPRFENFYGYAQVMSGAYVVQSVPLRYLNQEVLQWRDSTFGIEETIGCYAKGLAEALTPPKVLTTNTVKTRQRYTSVRFRLMPTVVANVGINWATPEAKCGGTVVEPDPRQGVPVAPNNSTSSPGDRPTGQGGDNSDRSANDGNFNPNDGLPPPPTPGDGTNFPSWNARTLTTTNPPTCTVQAFTFKFPALTNPAITPQYVPQGSNPFCSQATDGIITYNGATFNNPTGIVSIEFFFA